MRLKQRSNSGSAAIGIFFSAHAVRSDIAGRSNAGEHVKKATPTSCLIGLPRTARTAARPRTGARPGACASRSARTTRTGTTRATARRRTVMPVMAAREAGDERCSRQGKNRPASLSCL